MKILTKFRISNALDKKNVPESLRKKIEASPELRDFSRQATFVNHALRAGPEFPSTDAALHQSIMRAVRASAAEPAARQASTKIWLAPASAALAVICIWLIAHPARPTLPATPSEGAQTLAAAQSAWDLGREVSRAVPAAVVEPLSNELACVDHDLRNTTKFILAALP